MFHSPVHGKGVILSWPCGTAAKCWLDADGECENGHLDVLVNNAWGGHESLTSQWFDRPFWEQPMSHWGAMFDRGVRNHILASRYTAPTLVRTVMVAEGPVRGRFSWSR